MTLFTKSQLHNKIGSEWTVLCIICTCHIQRVVLAAPTLEAPSAIGTSQKHTRRWQQPRGHMTLALGGEQLLAFARVSPPSRNGSVARTKGKSDSHANVAGVAYAADGHIDVPANVAGSTDLRHPEKSVSGRSSFGNDDRWVAVAAAADTNASKSNLLSPNGSSGREGEVIADGYVILPTLFLEGSHKTRSSLGGSSVFLINGMTLWRLCLVAVIVCLGTYSWRIGRLYGPVSGSSLHQTLPP